MPVKNCGLIDLKRHINDSGELITTKNIPFEIKNVFYVNNISGVRGGHAHIKAKQAIFPLNGFFSAKIIDKHDNKNFTLNTPYCGLFLDNMTWIDMFDFSNDCIYIVFSSEEYDEIDYIRDFNAFIK